VREREKWGGKKSVCDVDDDDDDEEENDVCNRNQDQIHIYGIFIYK
jgi:hypothetical protein